MARPWLSGWVEFTNAARPSDLPQAVRLSFEPPVQSVGKMLIPELPRMLARRRVMRQLMATFLGSLHEGMVLVKEAIVLAATCPKPRKLTPLP